MRKDQVENKERVPVEGKRVRVIALQPFENRSEGEKFEMAEGRELKKMITLGWVRIDEPYDGPA